MFCITENKIGIKAQVVQPILYDNRRSKQKVQVTLEQKSNYIIDYPSTNLTVQIIQNGRADNGITLTNPQYIKDTEFVYNLEDNVPK